MANLTPLLAKPEDTTMRMAFVVMQIGDSELDHLFDTVIRPAIESVGLHPKRVDRHNEGGLLKSEIIQLFRIIRKS